ncbi:glycosyltransferase family 4 protein [Geomonas subterranea]|uniref:glycosyltransferase family 4 protein n=1 Tax=Geomonas subterranea TaxID=2847989 RepID=UPI001CD7F0BA|nr:glycosyltransferase family 4 protein [Geomonas fuzhouensis]
MRVWLITIGEPVPTDGHDERLLRTGILARLLSQNGHEVVWWCSSFDHTRKKQRTVHEVSTTVSDGYRLMVLRSRGYQRNISLARLLDHREHATRFAELAPREPIPDVILCSMPTIDLSRAAVKYAVSRKIPVVLDIRDLWPEIFVDLAPRWARGLARLILTPLFRDLRWACSHATALTSMTPQILQWGLGYANRSRSELDREFPFGYEERRPTDVELREANEFWKEHGIAVDSKQFFVVFFGTIGRQFDLDTVIDAARRLDGGSRAFHFILCGAGDRLDYYKKAAAGLSNVSFPGWVGSSEIWALMRIAHLGLAPYHNTKDFCASIPNKPIEYLSAGLPVLSPLTGVLHDLLLRNGCGVFYSEGGVKSLVDALELSYDDPAHLKIMANNAINLFQERFTAEIVYSNMKKYLEEVSNSVT